MPTSVSEDRLADLALDAAVEAQERIVRPDVAGKALRALARALHQTTGLNDSNESLCAHLSPGEVNVFSRALQEYGSEHLHSTAELMSELRNVLRALDDSEPTRDATVLRKLVNFCAALSDELSLRAQAISTARRPANPLRR